jgi:hypothetical protein
LHQALDGLAVRTTGTSFQPLNPVFAEPCALSEGLLRQASREPMPPQ